MELVDARNLARDLIAEHCPGWSFGFTGHLTVMGQCHHGVDKITLSRPLTLIADDDAIRDTILHEIAHALAGSRHGHDATWRRYCVQVGAPTDAQIHPSRVGNPRETLAPWVGTCPAGHVSPDRYFRKPRQRYACRICCAGKWQEQHVLVYTRVF